MDLFLITSLIPRILEYSKIFLIFKLIKSGFIQYLCYQEI